uniref:Zinc knuckle CX2CX4HX4C domain-containing protein n=1 Tax=Quercus lobata TaxID=97700 RepID=A0A7N2LGK0_QUELO
MLFTFEKKEEVERITSNSPWSFDKHLVVLQWYDKEVPLRALEFNKIPIWVQIHDVPIRFMNKTVAEKLCEVVGEVCKNIDEGETDGGSFLRMKVTIDVSKPLCRGRRISLSQGEQSWVSFKYERLPNICYWCGCLNHVDRDWDLWIESEGKLTKENQAYGAWIRATSFGKGRSSVLKVPGFYAAKKAQKKQDVSGESGVELMVVQANDQPPVAELVQTEEGGTFQGALNVKHMVSGGEDLNSDVAMMVSRVSWKSFEDRLGEIDKELARFDKESGVTEGVSIEGKYEGNKEASTVGRAEFIQGAVESVEAKVAEKMVTIHAREEEGNLG